MTIKAFAALGKGKPLEPFSFDPKPLAAHEVEVKISHCGVCHSDLHLVKDDWGMSSFPLVPGHEVIGTVHQVGSGVTQLKPGQRVGIGWQSDSCGECEWCSRGEENLCVRAAPTCVGRHGGFAEFIRVNSHFAIPVPDNLSSESAAPLLCGGITVFSPMRAQQLGPQHRVGIIGIGGLGHMALQFARAFGSEVTAFSTSADKEAEAKRMGAHHFVATQNPEAIKKLASSFDFILSTVNADLPWLDYVSALRPYGNLCFVGAPPSNLSVPVFSLISGNKRISASNTGNTAGLREMLQVAARHGVKAQTERFPLDQVNQAISRVARNEVRYRAVLEIGA
ncbi:NAD(P)-dependent alcohol dehydrogenase [Hyalangium minutum]|uniref:alcohol dehydrogenase (NADP(+)) n=1 Tax=Hyalangium minutum TaxID=394096 RepID=A0A085W2U0_9BACT|nr:NAD(P)-dependent alcohol dehydrogenase [Hyalangium minutum]KFE62003.1 Alcohol dehydrogenase [Hyalangium minutum]